MKLTKPQSIVSLALIPTVTLFSCSKQEPIKVVRQPLIVEVPEEPVVEEEAKPVVAPEPKPAPVVEVKEEVPEVPSEMQKALAGSVVYISGESVVRRNIEKKPDFYIIYFSAEWSGNCKMTIDDVISRYQSDIQPNPKLDMVMVSLDKDSEWLMKWGKTKKFPWPIITREQKVNVPFIKDLDDKIAPLFLLLNKNGVQLNAYSLEDCLKYVEKH